MLGLSSVPQAHVIKLAWWYLIVTLALGAEMDGSLELTGLLGKLKVNENSCLKKLMWKGPEKQHPKLFSDLHMPQTCEHNMYT